MYFKLCQWSVFHDFFKLSLLNYNTEKKRSRKWSRFFFATELIDRVKCTCSAISRSDLRSEPRFELLDVIYWRMHSLSSLISMKSELLSNRSCSLNFKVAPHEAYQSKEHCRVYTGLVKRLSLKISFSEKATKICAICLMVLTFTK